MRSRATRPVGLKPTLQASRRAQANHLPQAPKATQAKAPVAEAPKPLVAKAKTSAEKPSDAGQDAASVDHADDAKVVAATDVETQSTAKTQDPLVETPVASDPASMLAWLASLTQSDPSVKKGAGLELKAKVGGDDPSNATLSMSALLSTALATEDAKGAPVAMGHDPRTGSGDASSLKAIEAGRTSLETLMAAATEQHADFVGALSAEMGRGAALGGQSTVSGNTSQASDSLSTPVSSPEFPQVLAERVGMWVKTVGEGGSLSAQLHLNPAEMGPISIKISLDGQSAQVDFAVAAVETRKAIEESLQLLSEALGDAGIKLGGSGVFDQSQQPSFGQAPEQGPGRPAWMAAGAGLGDASVLADAPGARARTGALDGRAGGLDLYA